jgi:hypothetical protein
MLAVQLQIGFRDVVRVDHVAMRSITLRSPLRRSIDTPRFRMHEIHGDGRDE